MPNPFPGMNPYLESSTHWSTVHAALIHDIWAEIRANLPKGYRATIEERVYIVDSSVAFRADVAVLETNPYAPRSGTSTVTLPDAPEIAVMEEARETYINIWWGRDENRLVTSIEVLSPANKISGRGREEYVTKQRALLSSDVHLLEIDLLRTGHHTVAVPETALRPGTDYIVCLHRAETARFEFWPVSLSSSLPKISVPLNPEDSDIVLDLGALLNNFYEVGRLDDDIDYSVAPTPPLSPEQSAWCNELLRSAGKRT